MDSNDVFRIKKDIIMSLNSRDLQELKKEMMVNPISEYELHWDVTTKLIDIIWNQQAEIEKLVGELSAISERLDGVIADIRNHHRFTV